MRSKEEAIAKPMAGERWLLPMNHVRELEQVNLEWIKFKTTHKGKRSSHWTRHCSFRRWAANAEYLGGAK